MRHEWTTRFSEAREILFFFSALLPYLGIASLVIAAAILLRHLLSESAVILICIAALASAPVATYVRFSGYLRKKSARNPKIVFDGQRLILPTLSGKIVDMPVDNATQIEFAYYHLHGTRNTGVSRGLWLELRRDSQRVLITGNGAFVVPAGVATKNAPHAPFDEKVFTFAQDLISIDAEIRRALVS
jgi:hypothetical protein